MFGEAAFCAAAFAAPAVVTYPAGWVLVNSDQNTVWQNVSNPSTATWAEINTVQTPNWQNVSNPSTATWAQVGTVQTPSWTPVTTL